MASVNKVILLGHVGKDPELKYTPAGKAVCSFSLATQGYAKSGEKPKPDWHRCVSFGKTAELCGNLKKGAPLYVEGSISYRTWEDRDGNKHYQTDIIVRNIQFLGPRQQADPMDQRPPEEHAAQDSGFDPPQDFPF
jgi:single-strand DNA-binding protein